jgi:ribosomal protein L17
MALTTLDGETLELAKGTLLTVGDLHALGFTRTAINKFLTPADEDSDVIARPEPIQDYVSESRNYRSAPRRYTVEEVERALSMPLVREFLIKSKQRRASLDAKRKEVINQALGWEITVEDTPLSTIFTEAVGNYNERNAGYIRSGAKTALTLGTNDPQMISRVNAMAVQIIRHNHTNYDEAWQSFRSRVGAADAFEIIQRKTADAMKQAYPQLTRYIDYAVQNRTGWSEDESLQGESRRTA